MSEGSYEASEEFAARMDREDPLAGFRQEFLFPARPVPNGAKDSAKEGAKGSREQAIYLCGNSLGLQPRRARAYIEQELDDWARLGVEGHAHARKPWLPYHENVTEGLARLVGARPDEVVAMNSLTANLHLMLVSFYRPTPRRFRILLEASAFPSDQYAAASQARWHGFDPGVAVTELRPRAGEATLRREDILARIESEGDQIALILLGNVNYLTGQALDMRAITEVGHRKGCVVGFDLAHGAGNLLCRLHDWDVDFAVWCSYKYLNSGPGAIAGCFVHQRHGTDRSLPKLCGWWGHDKETRFRMSPVFEGIPGAESWQLSNPPIFQLAALRASLELFDAATMERIRAKGDLLTGYLEFLLDRIPEGAFTIVTPRDPAQRGCQLSLRIRAGARELVRALGDAGVIADFREPDIIRVAPAPLYNSFMDVIRFARVLEGHARGSTD